MVRKGHRAVTGGTQDDEILLCTINTGKINFCIEIKVKKITENKI